MTSTRSRSLITVSCAGALALALAACGPDPEPSGDVTGGPARGEATRIVADDNHFDPNGLELDAGEEVEIEIRNNDDTAHNFAIGSLDLNTGTIGPGEVATARFTVPDDGVEFVCTLHDGMSGRIEAT
jgi:plastocyanin